MSDDEAPGNGLSPRDLHGLFRRHNGEAMFLTDSQVTAIAHWEPAEPGFGRDDPATPLRVHRIVNQIKATGVFGCDIVQDDGMANYYVLFAYTNANVAPSAPYARVEGLLIYLSACAPVCVVGRSQRCVGPGFEHLLDPLAIDALMDPDATDGDLERCAFEAICRGGYKQLAGEEVSRPLPPGVKLYEHCRGPEPHDRVFHALFAETD